MESLQVGLLPSGNDNRAQGWGMEGRTEQLGEARALERPVVHRSLAQPYAGQITGSSRYTLASLASLAAGEAQVSGVTLLRVFLKPH